jgi:glycosyltransferase involved in cell wall biosynthesis
MIRLSLIITTYNRAQEIETTMEMVLAQRFDASQWECIIVDNNSTDDTRQRVEKIVGEHKELNLRYVFEPQQGLSYARNRGIAESRGEIIAFIDDDETIVYDYVSRYINFFDRYPQAMAAGGRIVADYLSGRPRWMSQYVARPIANPLYYGDYIKPFPRGKHPGGGNMAVRREVFERIGGFDTELGRSGGNLIGGEECDFFKRMYDNKLPIYYVPRALIYHRIPDEKLTEEYTTRLFHSTGLSQRIRAKREGRLFGAYLSEIAKWGATLLLCLTYRPSQSRYLLKMRCNISKGLFRG